MRLNSVVRIGLLAIILAAVFTGCTSTTENKDAATALDSTQKVATVQMPDYPFATPLEITKMLNAAGAGFIVAITNPVTSIDKYGTEKSKALNLGVYGADLSYSSVYNKVQETNQFLKNAKKLTEDLGILNAFTQNEVDRIQKNIEKTDSLYRIINGSFENTYKSLNESGKGQVSVLVLAGGWIEGMYLATQLAKTAKQNDKIVKGILDQKVTLEKLIATLNFYKDNADVQGIVKDLAPIKAIFDEAKETLTPKQLDDFTKKVETMRETVVK